jgi:hypothetical protein
MALQLAEKLNFFGKCQNGSRHNAVGTIRLPRVMVFYPSIGAFCAQTQSFFAQPVALLEVLVSRPTTDSASFGFVCAGASISTNVIEQDH